MGVQQSPGAVCYDLCFTRCVCRKSMSVGHTARLNPCCLDLLIVHRAWVEAVVYISDLA